MLLLLADRDRLLAAELATRLDAWSVEIVRCPAAACERISVRGFDALVLDEMTVGARGLGVLERRRAEGDATPALLLRAERSGTSELIDALVAGVTDCIRKPASAGHIADKLGVLMGSRIRSSRRRR